MSTVPQSFLDELQKIDKDFICSGKKPEVKHSILIANYMYHGGGNKNIKIVIASNSLKTGWIKGLWGKKNCLWKALAK